MRRTALLLASLAAAGAFSGACSGGSPAKPSAGASAVVQPAPSSFQGVPPSTYVAKVKDILVGLPPTDAEVSAVAADSTKLAGLIDEWMKLPQYSQKMMTFFELAFQQTQVSINDFAEQTFPRQADINGTTQALLVQNARESFARTMLELIAEGRPLTDAMTTTRFMMTPALLEFYGFLDAWQIDDTDKVTDRLKAANPTMTITVEASAGPIAITDTLNPASPNYMHWYDPDVGTAGAATAMGAGCGTDPIVFPASAITMHWLLLGGLDAHKNAAGTACTQFGGTAKAPQLAGTDFSSWKMVNLRTPNPGEQPTPFYDLVTLRSATEMVLHIPRVGFFSTPAFFANWQTNTSNQMRVTTNQALIVATGASIDGSDTTTPSTTPGLDGQHAAPDSACFACHQLLDPTRSILASTYSWSYHDQADATLLAQKGLFAFQGVIKPVSSVSDFGATLAAHPLFAQAWAEKLCYYAGSSACEASDPELQRIVNDFKASSYSWNVLVRELLSSPLITYASTTQTAVDQGEVVAVSRRDHLCAALDARMGFGDICALDAASRAALTTTIPEIVSGLPSDGYGRGAVAPVLPNQPTLFFRAGTENICESVAQLVIDPPKNAVLSPASTPTKTWSSAQPGAAIADFVQIVMALPPSDPRSAQASAILTAHFTSATKGGASASDALKSTFTAACLAPSAVSIGL